ncbi:MAG TPA: clostripain-related cysteine peptidase [Pyrinomonadaceae bacterium]|nr:clostripain-related cysteine peptidase [Pyrinomonadaceae bacterium]
MTREVREWTIMFYFASDNPLGPEIVSQLKSIKQAGFHPDANVIVQFDPHPENASTHIFDINRINKLKAQLRSDKKLQDVETLGTDATAEQKKEALINYKIGYLGYHPNDPYTWNVMEDKLWRDEEDANGKPIRERVEEELAREEGISYKQPKPAYKAKRKYNAKEPSPKVSLQNFLNFCAREYPARHYMLFILGHGVVVGNDIFLYDEHADENSLTLKGLREVLEKFKTCAEEVVPDAEFQLVGFHSCSMSSLEVAYELEGTFNYMLASQGPSFVGSWSYRQVIMRVLNDLKRKVAFNHPVTGRNQVRKMLTKIASYCHFNSYDFLVAGYSSDLCLCDLNCMAEVKEQVRTLSLALIEALRSGDTWTTERIVLAHWDAQSHWQENYTDLHDFCFCLRRRLSDEAGNTPQHPSQLVKLDAACKAMMTALEKETEIRSEGKKDDDDDAVEMKEEKKRFIVRAGYTGPWSQYSHGVSVFFPWSQPIRVEFLNQYENYKFVQHYAMGESWLDFLLEYFERTERPTRVEEESGGHIPAPTIEKAMMEEFAYLGLREAGQSATLDQTEKPGSHSTTGDGYGYPSLKNHPPFLRRRPCQWKRTTPKASASSVTPTP